MVICKFFLQGNCRFGSSCRFEHSYNSKYSYHAQSAQGNAIAPQTASITDEQLINQVKVDILAALKGGQWLLSSYAPFKEKPVIPGIPDLSPEEARLFIYEAKANNTLDQAITFMNNLSKETRLKYEQLLQPNATITNTLRKLYNGENVTSPFSGQNNAFGQSNNAASSVFRSAVQNTGSVFGQNNSPSSVFGQSNTAASIFGQANSAFGTSPAQDTARSIFAQATQAQNVFASPQQQSQTPFGVQSPDPAKSIFAQAVQNSAQPSQPFQPQQAATSIFANASQQFFGQPTETFQQNSSPFGQSPFNQQPSQPHNVFQASVQPSNVFGSNVSAQHSSQDVGIYSIESELSEDDLKAFRSNDFKLGFVPELPPPQSYCVK